MIEETYKEIPGYPAYRISTNGNIQSRWRWGSYYSGFKTEDRWKTLPLHNDCNGYLQVHLSDGISKPKTWRVHSLMAITYLGKKPEGLICVRHLDGNPSNNNLENLLYGTYLENEKDKINHGTWDKRKGGAKLTPDQVMVIRCSKKSQMELAYEFNVSRPTITRIINNSIWREQP